MDQFGRQRGREKPKALLAILGGWEGRPVFKTGLPRIDLYWPRHVSGGAAFNLRDPLLQPFQVMVLNVLNRELTMLVGQTVVQGPRPAHPIRLFPNAITASVNPAHSSPSPSATPAP